METILRYGGWLLELVGIAFAAVDVTATVREQPQLDQPGIIRRGWMSARFHARSFWASVWARCRALTRRHHREGGNTASVTLDVHGAGHAVHSDNVTLEQHETTVAEQVAQLRSQIQSLETAMTSRFDDEAEARAAASKRTSKRIDDLVAGEIRLQKRTVATLVPGITLGTVPDLVAHVVRLVTPL